MRLKKWFIVVSDFSHLILEVNFTDHFDFLSFVSDFLFKVQNTSFVYVMHRPHFHLPWLALTVKQTSLLGNIHPTWKQACSIFINSPVFFLLWSCTLLLCDCLCLVYFYGAAMQTIQMWMSFILRSIHSLAFVRRERKAQTHIAFHELLCQTSTQTNRWQAWCELPVDQTRQTWSSQAHLA